MPLFILLLSWSLLFYPAQAWAKTDSYAKAQVNQYTVDRGSEFVYTIEIMNTGEKQYSPDVSLPDFFQDFQIGNVFTRSSVNILNGKTHIITFKEVHLIARNTGEITIPPTQVKMIDADSGESFTIETNKVTIMVNDATGQQAVPTPTPEIDILRPIKSMAHLTTRQWLPIVISLALMALVIGVMIYLKYRPAPKPPQPAEPVDTRTPLERAMEGLEAAQRLKAEGKINEFYTALSAILRRYMAEEYEFKAQEATTREMLNLMDAMHFKPVFLEKYRQYFLESDQVKFANITPPTEKIENVFPWTKQLIQEPDKRELPPPPVTETQAEGAGADVAAEEKVTTGEPTGSGQPTPGSS